MGIVWNLWINSESIDVSSTWSLLILEHWPTLYACGQTVSVPGFASTSLAAVQLYHCGSEQPEAPGRWTSVPLFQQDFVNDVELWILCLTFPCHKILFFDVLFWLVFFFGQPLKNVRTLRLSRTGRLWFAPHPGLDMLRPLWGSVSSSVAFS